jgi:Rrf2 family protein
MFSRSCEYALQGVLYIALHSKNGQAVGLKEIAESLKIPMHFLSKILQLLVRHKVLSSIKGPNGGFLLSDAPQNLTLFKIVEIVDGLDIFDRCGIGLKVCSDETPCPIHHKYKILKEDIKNLLKEKTVATLSDEIRDGVSNIIQYEEA